MPTQTIKEKMNVNIDHSGAVFFSDAVVVSHGPNKFVMDFSQTTPRFDFIVGQRQQSLVIKHKTVILDPQIAKDFFNVLKSNIEKYEKSFGKIKPPKPKKQERAASKADANEASRYIG